MQIEPRSFVPRKQKALHRSTFGGATGAAEAHIEKGKDAHRCSISYEPTPFTHSVSKNSEAHEKNHHARPPQRTMKTLPSANKGSLSVLCFCTPHIAHTLLTTPALAPNPAVA